MKAELEGGDLPRRARRELRLERPAVVRLPPKSNAEIVLARAAQVSMVVVGIVAAVLAIDAAQFVLAPVALAVVVGLMLGPLASRLERAGCRPWLSSAIVFLLFIAGLACVVLALLGPLSYWAGEMPRIWERIQAQMAELRAPLEALRGAQEELRDVTGNSGITVAVDDGSPVESIAMMAPSLGAQILLFMASLYFFVATRDDIRASVLRVCVNRRLRWRVAHVFRDVEMLVSRYLLSITVINFALGVAVALVLWLVGVPSPALWGALAAVLNFIVYVGPAVMATTLFVVGLGTFDTLTGGLMPPLVYLSINLIEAQFVTPTVIGRTMTLNPFLVLLALTFWIWVWGPIGGFIAIPAVLVIWALARNILPGAAP